jgi:hypothetical protein
MSVTTTSGRWSLWLLLVGGLATLVAACAAPTQPPEPRDRLDAALLDAVQANRLTDVGELLRRGANPNARGAKQLGGMTALTLSVVEGSAEIARALLAAGANPNLSYEGSFNDTTPLIAATATNHPEIARLLLEHGANVNVRTGPDGSGSTALRFAAHFGYDVPMTLLLAYGATIERQDLQIAIVQGLSRLRPAFCGLEPIRDGRSTTDSPSAKRLRKRRRKCARRWWR